jgi:hypothetical protein
VLFRVIISVIIIAVTSSLLFALPFLPAGASLEDIDLSTHFDSFLYHQLRG